MFVSGFFFILIIIGFVFPTFTRRFFYSISVPLWKSENFIAKPFVGIKFYFVTKNYLINKNLALVEENNRLELSQIDHEILLKENQELKEQIGRTSGKNLVFAKVLSKPPRSPYDTFVIDIGSNEGIVPGSRVYLSSNVIIGLVTSVTPGTSLVKMFSTGDNKQESINSRTGASYVLTGKGGANFQVEVPKEADILWGDAFLYPSLGVSVLGTVYYIDSNSQSSFKTLYLRIPGNVFQTQSVFVDNATK